MSALVSVSRHTLRQLKFIVPGGLVTFALHTHQAFWRIVTGESAHGTWAWTTANLALVLGFVTFVIFVYILFLPWIKGEKPDFRHWRQSGVLSTAIPILTASIVAGWSLLSYALGTNLGYIKGIIGASGLYALVIGLIGLIPAPRVYQRS
ncbi:hypothetical protein PHLGIDRAFT_88466 [Phlebiopsis gigantea 11061_1 CR5-6]|uniref:Uncharacterized protein n=1 Tax=Phlebiopsis gigantea (strain 11061_1 CR5-6) TaxID=745531 RepID=A0A0C3SBR8_PHLG1|nr:hypothetical protein PHLGIDRAFT_88466 [Phlebiopsis gigantea 11061_1 CR5-6]